MPLTWDHPDSDPIGDIRRWVQRVQPSNPDHNLTLVIPHLTYSRYGRAHLEQVAFEVTGRHVTVVPNMPLSNHLHVNAVDYDYDDGG